MFALGKLRDTFYGGSEHSIVACLVRVHNEAEDFLKLYSNILYATLLRPYYTAKSTREILISNIHLLLPQKWSQFVHFSIEKVFPRGQP